AYEQAGKASIVLYLFDAAESEAEEVRAILQKLREQVGEAPEIIPIANKIDKSDALPTLTKKFAGIDGTRFISAEKGDGMDSLEEALVNASAAASAEGKDIVVTNIRHYEALRKTNEALDGALRGLQSEITGDFLAIDIRRALHHLGEITGEITTDDLLGNIFSKFCIGK
ncbi:MAG: tRNA uridine-5-carboxymethylaminomethyl(34) synthesis GTPase MnmE, partial [Cryomorphaceae bacterium]